MTSRSICLGKEVDAGGKLATHEVILENVKRAVSVHRLPAYHAPGNMRTISGFFSELERER